jgi:uncharacterized protein YwgA
MELTRSIRDAFGWSKHDQSRKEEVEICRNDIEMNEKYLILLLGSLEKGSFSGAVKLVKAIFLAQSEAKHKGLDGNFSYNFYRWDYGPFDSAIYKDLESLRSKGLLQISQEYTPYLEKTYALTETGKKQFNKVKAEVDTTFGTIVSKWANKVNQMRRDDVLKFVYDKSNVKSYEMGDKVNLPDVD